MGNAGIMAGCFRQDNGLGNRPHAAAGIHAAFLNPAVGFFRRQCALIHENFFGPVDKLARLQLPLQARGLATHARHVPDNAGLKGQRFGHLDLEV